MKKNNQSFRFFAFFAWGMGLLGYGLCFMFIVYLLRSFFGNKNIDLIRASVGPVIGFLLIMIARKYGSPKEKSDK